jgi:phosphoenolpyruvate synthase/pyruvate phosphate dikinase
VLSMSRPAAATTGRRRYDDVPQAEVDGAPDGVDPIGHSSAMIDQYVLGLDDVDARQVAVVGGKGAQLGSLSRIDGICVPAGFCVTTDAFRRIMTAAPSVADRLEQLSSRDPDDGTAISALSAEIRRTIEATAIPDDLTAAIARALIRLGDRDAYAVRSSATAEDLPGASFAGQHDTYLNVVGLASTLRHISRCWASLFTERAAVYRNRHGIDHREVQMAVLVQRMVFSQSAGVLFTADPVTGDRRVACVEAAFGLGEAMVSGLVDVDVFQVRGGDIVARTVATKHRAVRAASAGGTQLAPVDAGCQDHPALTDAQVVRLVELGRRIEAHFGRPQDIEWCLADDDVRIVQSRPITTLFPIPATGDGEKHVYVSVGHQQMMTDPMTPLGLSVWQLTAGRPMHEAGGRLFVDVTPDLASPATRARLIEGLGRSDPLIRDALQTIVDRGDVLPRSPDERPEAPPPGGAPAPIEPDPAIVDQLIARTVASVAAVTRDIRETSGAELLDLVVADIQEMKRLLFLDPQAMQVIMAGMEALWWLNDQLLAWLGEKNAADTLTQSVPHNVTSEMGLALLDVADAIRPHPEVVTFLQHVDDELSLEELDRLAGGREARVAIETWLDAYGMRCVGEIDIARPRWIERPATLVPLILGHVQNFEPGAGRRRFDEGRRQALAKEQQLLERVRALPDGERKADEAARMIHRLRAFIGYREYPKYGIVCRYFVYKQALLEEAERLVHAGVLRAVDDMFFLTFQELRDVVYTGVVDHELIDRRKVAFTSHRAFTPPRVITSDGEVVSGSYHRDDAPAGALIGLAVSAGTAEGRARVIVDIAQADLEPGDILVTTHTDPSWTPLFVAVSGLVTEVGGLMTHGSVIAREYGLPAVVGVENATRMIADGQRIRVHGTDGYVELLP